MLINCDISMYEIKRNSSDPAPGVGISSLNLFTFILYAFTMCECDSCGNSL